jgi:mycothione reductase
LADVPFHTSDTIMRLDELPASMVIIGGGFIAAELGHVFSAFGTKVSIISRAARLLPAEDEDISARFTALAADRFELHLAAKIASVSSASGQITVAIDGPKAGSVTAEVLLVATGRHPRTAELDPAAAGLEQDEHGHLVTDDTYATNVPGIWAFGDVTNHMQLKHLANAEMRVVGHNIMHPEDPRQLPSKIVPHAVFSEPQIASVGLTQAEAERRGLDVTVATRPYSETAYGWALEDTTSFVKIIADPTRRIILGAHIIGPEAALLLQPLVQAMMLDLTVDQLAHDVVYIHPALSEVVEQALLEL